MSSLRHLGISSNQLTGVVPSSLGDLVGLEGQKGVIWIDLSDNRLSGQIPSSLGDLEDLATLDLSFNELSGAIPSALGGLPLDLLLLGNNKLEGSIPSSFGQLFDLITLDLSSNLLSGTIPSSLRTLSFLSELLLGNNSLTGPVPELSSAKLIRCEVHNNTDLCAYHQITNKCTVGLATCNLDCRVMNAWLPKIFDSSTCCSQSGIVCINDRITNLYVYFISYWNLEL
jgi:Leucine-rich repeat (LRR) protein